MSSTVGSSEINENNTAVYVDWKEQHHVDCVKMVLPLKQTYFGENEIFQKVTPIAAGLGAKWELHNRAILIVYAGGKDVQVRQVQCR